MSVARRGEGGGDRRIERVNREREFTRAYVSSAAELVYNDSRGKEEEGRHPELPSRTLIYSARPSGTPSSSDERGGGGVLPEK